VSFLNHHFWSNLWSEPIETSFQKCDSYMHYAPITWCAKLKQPNIR